MSLFYRILRFIFSIYAFSIFLILMLLIFPFVVIASLWGKIGGGNTIYILCNFWADAFMLFCGMPHKNLYEAPHDPSRPWIFVFNHGSYMDIPIMLAALRQQQFRALGKAEMTKIPIFGFIYKSAVVTVDRSDTSHRAKSVATLKSILAKNISIALAPEGTFNMSHEPLKDFYDGAFRIAIETQTAIKPVLFLDAIDRLHYRSIFSLNPGRSRAVFLEPVEVAGLSSEDTAALKKKVYEQMEAALIKYKASWIK